jgi:hypothetical protein
MELKIFNFFYSPWEIGNIETLVGPDDNDLLV